MKSISTIAVDLHNCTFFQLEKNKIGRTSSTSNMLDLCCIITMSIFYFEITCVPSGTITSPCQLSAKPSTSLQWKMACLVWPARTRILTVPNDLICVTFVMLLSLLYLLTLSLLFCICVGVRSFAHRLSQSRYAPYSLCVP